MAETSLVPVEFHGTTLYAVTVDGIPHVALRPICDALGIDWKAQYNRLKRNPILAEGMVVTTVPSAGGEQQTIVIPINKLNGWLFGISAARVKPELRERLVQYQRECFDALARHFGAAPAGTSPAAGDAVDYRRIGPAQAQALKELVHHIVGLGIQSYAETWARLHRRFKVNSYLELPAARFAEAVEYLRGQAPLALPAPGDRPLFDPAGILLTGQADGPVHLTDAQRAMIEHRAWELAGEAYKLIHAHIERRIAWRVHDEQRNDQAIGDLVRSVTPGNAFTHHYRTHLGTISTTLTYLQQTANKAMQRLSDDVDRLTRAGVL